MALTRCKQSAHTVRDRRCTSALHWEFSSYCVYTVLYCTIQQQGSYKDLQLAPKPQQSLAQENVIRVGIQKWIGPQISCTQEGLGSTLLCWWAGEYCTHAHTQTIPHCLYCVSCVMIWQSWKLLRTNCVSSAIQSQIEWRCINGFLTLNNYSTVYQLDEFDLWNHKWGINSSLRINQCQLL